MLCLGKSELKGEARVVDRVARCRTRAAVRTGDEDFGCSSLCDAGRDGSHAGLAHELHRDACVRVRALQVKDELGEVFDGVDVVVRWGRDEPDAGGGMADARHPGPHLAAGQVATLAGLRALSHLYLYLDCATKIAAGDPETSRGDLLYGRVQAVAVRQRRLAGRVLAALARV